MMRRIVRGTVVASHIERITGRLLTFGCCATFLGHIADLAAAVSLRFTVVGGQAVAEKG